MKKLTVILLLIPFIVSAHPIKMSLFFVNYSPETASANLECQLFAGDLVHAIADEMEVYIDPRGEWSEVDQKIVNAFIKKHVEIKFGSQDLQLDYATSNYNPANQVITLTYEFSALNLSTGEEVVVSNDLFFKQHGRIQSNIFQLQIPRVVKTTVTCYMNDYSKAFAVR